MSSTGRPEDWETRLQSASEWFELAVGNAKSAVLLGKKSDLLLQALYMTQQSMEATTKGLARIVGEPHRELRTWRHNNLRLFVWIVNQIVTLSESESYISVVLSSYNSDHRYYRTVQQLQNMLELTASPRESQKMSEAKSVAAREFFTSMLQMPPGGVRFMLDLLSKLDNTIKSMYDSHPFLGQLKDAPFALNMPSTNENFSESCVRQILAQCQERGSNLNRDQVALVHKLGPQIVKSSLYGIGLDQIRSDLEANNGQYSLGNNVVDAMFEMPMAFIGILIVGGLVWPHESFPRYAADPEAPDTFEEAAEQTRLLGSRHYSESLGVIKYIRELTRKALTITESISKSHTTIPRPGT